ncbi:RHS repeat domain-containing protein [Chryseobacterium camelliae]|uniref:RHS repeat domain-containing protein n=1 Tax=Chryseobacterium camelliae TaxID=1265445 RepID=UPI001E59F7F8|nr:RHS repeat-associated core domain-containing protein [Chryseobacterium camelliae]
MRFDNLGNDLFGYAMKYNNPENTSLSTGRFNGNIAEIDWKTSTVANDNKRRYFFTYDHFNRLQQGIYSEPGSSVINNNNYNEQLTYDLNGNILTLKRFSKPYSGTTPELIDDLVYNYTGNRLDKITLPSGTANNASGYNALQNTITYDANGSMINQLDKNIASIEYNHLDLPRLFTTGSGKFKQTIAYTYRADGIKVGKNVGGRLFFSTTTDYLDGFQYQVSLVAEGDDSSNFLQFFPTSEGYFDFQQNRYIYNYTDHLGNVRLSYFNNGSGIEVLEENNYYPFGLKHGGYNELAGNPAYQYKYNGKELQTETGMYDYGARFYMPDIGRWGVVDPLAEKMTRYSPYNYAFNNPISFIDPDGREGKGWIHQQFEDGSTKLTYKSNINTVQEAMEAGYVNVYGVSETGEITNTNDGSVAYSLNADGTVTDAAGETTKGYLSTSGGINIQAKDAFDLTKWLSHLGNEGGDFYANLGGAAPQEYSNPFFRGDIDKIVDAGGYFGGMLNSLSRGNDGRDLLGGMGDIMSLIDSGVNALKGNKKIDSVYYNTWTVDKEGKIKDTLPGIPMGKKWDSERYIRFMTTTDSARSAKIKALK